MQNTAPFLSLVLATVGRVDTLYRFFDSLPVADDFEVLLIDQNRDDRLLPVVLYALDRNIRINWVSSSKKCLSTARNLGIELATGQLIGFPDDDCWYASDVVERLRNAYAAYTHHGGFMARWVEREPVHKPAHLLDYALLLKFRESPVNSISLFIKKQELLSIGGFDHMFGVGQPFGAGEETDLTLRLLKADVQVLYLPDIEVHHHWQFGVPAGTQPAAVKLRSRGTGAIYAKHAAPLWIVARGMLAPLAKALLRPWRISPLAMAWAIASGRMQGYWMWYRLSRRTHALKV